MGGGLHSTTIVKTIQTSKEGHGTVTELRSAHRFALADSKPAISVPPHPGDGSL
jgi:hypothetical protein